MIYMPQLNRAKTLILKRSNLNLKYQLKLFEALTFVKLCLTFLQTNTEL